MSVQEIRLNGADAPQFVLASGTCTTATVPSQGQTCTVAVAFSPTAPGREAYAGIPFDAATEALDAWAGVTRRREDHVGTSSSTRTTSRSPPRRARSA